MIVTIANRAEALMLLDSDPTYIFSLTCSDGRDLLKEVEQTEEIDAKGVWLVAQRRSSSLYELNFNPQMTVRLPEVAGEVTIAGGEGLLRLLVDEQPLVIIHSGGRLWADSSIRNLTILGTAGALGEDVNGFSSLARVDLLDFTDGVEAVLQTVRKLPRLQHVGIQNCDAVRDLSQSQS